MEKLKITEGEWTVSGETKSFPISYIITATIDDKINRPFTLDVAHVLPKIRGKKENAILIADAGTTYNKCHKLPSELMEEVNIKAPAVALLKQNEKLSEENRELVEALKAMYSRFKHSTIDEVITVEALLTKIENKE